MPLSQPSLRKQVYGDHLIKVLLPCGDNLQVLYEKSAVHNGLEIVEFQASEASKSGESSELVFCNRVDTIQYHGSLRSRELGQAPTLLVS